MSRQIAPHIGYSPSPLLEERIHHLELRIIDLESKVALLTGAVERLARRLPDEQPAEPAEPARPVDPPSDLDVSRVYS